MKVRARHWPRSCVSDSPADQVDTQCIKLKRVKLDVPQRTRQTRQISQKRNESRRLKQKQKDKLTDKASSGSISDPKQVSRML